MSFIDKLDSTQPYKMITFPREILGQKVKVPMRVLSALDAAQAKADAEKKAQMWLADVPSKQKGYEEIYKSFCAVNLLWYCLRDEVDMNKPLFPQKDDILRLLNLDEIATLVEEYLMLTWQKSPTKEQLTQDEVNVWVNQMTSTGVEPDLIMEVLTIQSFKQIMEKVIEVNKSLIKEIKELKDADGHQESGV